MISVNGFRDLITEKGFRDLIAVDGFRDLITVDAAMKNSVEKPAIIAP